MARTVAEGMWEMLASAGVRRCYGIVGDALNPVIDALRRNGSVATAKGFTLSIAKQVLSGKMDEVIETVKHNVRLA